MVSTRRGGFSLLEVAIALLIFVIGALALLRIFPGGLDVLEDSGNRRIAAQMSQNVLTSYNTGGDLAITTPDSIFDGDINNASPSFAGWNDYPLSLTGLRRDKGTIPTTTDDIGNSALGHLRFVRNERQKLIGGVCFTNYVVDRHRVNVFREGTVEGVKLEDATLGKLDFRLAHYPGTPNPLPFREPMIVAGTITQSGASATGATINGGTIELPRPAPATTSAQTTYVIPFNLDDSRLRVVPITGSVNAPAATANGGYTVTVDTANNTVTVTVDNSVDNPPTPPTPQPEAEFQITVTPPDGASVDYQNYVVHIPASGGGTTLTSHLPTPQPAPIVRAPYLLRGGSVDYYISSEWSNGGAYHQPFIIAPSDASYGVDGTGSNIPKIPSVNNASGPFALLESGTVTFRQFVKTYATGTSVSSDRVRIDLGTAPVTNYNDVGSNSLPVNGLTQVALDYSVYGWDYLTEFTSQFGTPFPGSPVAIPETAASPTADELVWTQFIRNENSMTQPSITRSSLAELRTSIGNLRGPIYIKGVYSNGASTDVQFDPRDTPTTYASLSAQQQRDFRKRMTEATKQGRFYLSSQTPDGMSTASLQNARLYYRSRDNWAQQIGVVASHYLPYAPNVPIDESWRDYFHAADGYVYFHAAEAGKSLVYTHKVTNSATGEVTYPEVSLEVKPDVLFATALPSNVPSTFTTTTFLNANDSTDPRNGKFYLARSRDTVSNYIYDICRASGSSGISVRTLWLNSNRYAEEVAQ